MKKSWTNAQMHFFPHDAEQVEAVVLADLFPSTLHDTI